MIYRIPLGIIRSAGSGITKIPVEINNVRIKCYHKFQGIARTFGCRVGKDRRAGIRNFYLFGDTCGAAARSGHGQVYPIDASR